MEVTIIAGCGGGYDLFCGLSFYHELFNKHNQNNIILINYSFTEKEIINNSHNCKKLIDKCYVIDHTQINDQKYDYFPEHYLSKIVNGWIDPKPEVKEKIAATLGCSVNDIFFEGREELKVF